MPKINYDNTAAAAEQLPDGDYHYEVTACDFALSAGAKTNGCETMEVKVAFFADQSFAAKRAQWTETFIFHPSCEWKLSLFAKSSNLTVGGQVPAHGAAIDFTQELVLGLRGIATVRSKAGIKDPTRKYNYVAAWLTKEKLPRAVQVVKSKIDDEDVPF